MLNIRHKNRFRNNNKLRLCDSTVKTFFKNKYIELSRYKYADFNSSFKDKFSKFNTYRHKQHKQKHKYRQKLKLYSRQRQDSTFLKKKYKKSNTIIIRLKKNNIKRLNIRIDRFFKYDTKYNIKRFLTSCYLSNSIILQYIAVIISFFKLFIYFFHLLKRIVSIYKFFKKIFINNKYFLFFNLFGNKKLYIYYYIMFKKHNTLMRKKFYHLYNLHPKFYKKIFKKNVNLLNSHAAAHVTKLKRIRSLYRFKFLLKNTKHLRDRDREVFNSKRKIKKVILKNRKFYKLLNYNCFNTSKKLTNDINIKAKQKITNNLLGFEYLLSNVILRSNIIKSYSDLVLLAKGHGIYLNRKCVSNVNFILNIGDIIEFTLSYRLFNYSNYFKKIFKKNITKIKYKL